jgi:hypothetical protein
MLATEAAFPFAGSFALALDERLPKDQQRLELVRILERGVSAALISLPLRIGAGANCRVAIADLVDGTPLTLEETAELERLTKTLRSQVRNRGAAEKRRDSLRKRTIHSAILRGRAQQAGPAARRTIEGGLKMPWTRRWNWRQIAIDAVQSAVMGACLIYCIRIWIGAAL